MSVHYIHRCPFSSMKQKHQIQKLRPQHDSNAYPTNSMQVLKNQDNTRFTGRPITLKKKTTWGTQILHFTRWRFNSWPHGDSLNKKTAWSPIIGKWCKRKIAYQVVKHTKKISTTFIFTLHQWWYHTWIKTAGTLDHKNDELNFSCQEVSHCQATTPHVQRNKKISQ